MRKERASWIVWNCIFAGALYVGVWRNQSLIGVGVAAFIWLMLVFYLSALYLGASTAVRKNPVPLVVGLAFDAAVLAVLIKCDWYVTATAYALSALALELSYRRSPEKAGNE